MSLEIVTVPCLRDNYAYLLHDALSGETALVDAPEAAPVLAALAARGWRLGQILLTHHHADHSGAADALRAETGAQVLGAGADAHRLPRLDAALAEGDNVAVGRAQGHVLDVSGHTLGHLALHFPQARAAFTADSLMALGCGRVFEGTMQQMYASLSKLDALPGETRIYSGHNYGAGNARFAASIEPANPALAERSARIAAADAAGQPIVPSTLDEERATNPFLRTGQPGVKAAVGLSDATDAEVFAELRRRKDAF